MDSIGNAPQDTNSQVQGRGSIKSTKSRRPAACKRCNERRVRCDASAVGTPCSRCQKARSSPCTLVESRRTRGSAGRYVCADVGADGAQSSGSVAAASTNRQPTKTAQEADFSLDLTRLCKNDLGISPLVVQGSSASTDTSSNHKALPTTSGSRPSFLGESWYASFLLRVSNNEHDQLHQGFSRSHESEGEAAQFDANVEQIEINNELRTECTATKEFPADMPPRISMELLIGTYFSRFHVLLPVLDSQRFLISFRNGTVSRTLLRCVLFVGSIHCDRNVYHRLGYNARADAGDALFNKARVAFDEDHDSDRITLLQSSFLLHYWWGLPTNFRDSLWWLSTAIRSAQCLGLHRRVKDNQRNMESKSLWKRIWWCLYIRDRQISMALLTPMAINDLDCDIEDLCSRDFVGESEETAEYLIAQAKLSRIVSSIYFCHLSPSRVHLNKDSEHRRNAKLEIQSTLHQWSNSLPGKMNYSRDGGNQMAVFLQIVYNFYMLALHQRLSQEAFSGNVDSDDFRLLLEAAGNITRLTEDSLINWGPEYFPMTCVTAVFAAMTVQYIGSHSSNTYKSQLLYQKLRSNMLSLRQFEECYILARWVRNLFKDIIERPRKPNPNTTTATVGNQNLDQSSSHNIMDTQVANFSQTASSAIDYHSPASSLGSSLYQQASPMGQEATKDNVGFSRPRFENNGTPNLMSPEDFYSHLLDYSSTNPLQMQGLQFLVDLGMLGANSDY